MLESSLDTHIISFFFRVAVQTTALQVCAPFYAKTMFTIANEVRDNIVLFHKSFMTVMKGKSPGKSQTRYNYFITVRFADTSNFVLKHIMTSLLDPPCLIEHELYVENAVWILHTLSTRKCSSNDRLRPRGRGVGTLIFSYIRRHGPFLGAQNLEYQYFFLVFRRMIFFFWGGGGYEEYFLGCLKFLIFF